MPLDVGRAFVERALNGGVKKQCVALPMQESHACRPWVDVQLFPALIHGMQHRGDASSMIPGEREVHHKTKYLLYNKDTFI